MATNKLQITDLDFSTIKTNLKEFLRSQTEFTDYDFEGSGLSVLLDILAYNTHYNAYYLNMVANESFLDTAILRDSVVSHAKLLGYTPKSVTSAKAFINLTVMTGDTTPDTLTIPRGLTFKSSPIDNMIYDFVVLDSITVDKTVEDYIFLNVPLYEGKLTSYKYTYNVDSNPKCIFTIPDTEIDTSTLVVNIQESETVLTTKTYTLSNDITNVNSESEVYFLQEGQGGKYQIYFGNGTIGKQLVDGSIVIIEYLVSSGANGNKVTDLALSTQLNGYTDYVIDTLSESSGGSDREDIEDIRKKSIIRYPSQNRLVTLKDYESYLLEVYPIIDSIVVWGGEEEDDPVYGKVFLSIKPKDNYYIPTSEKDRIIEEYIKPRSIVTINAEIRDPDYIYIKLINKVSYYKIKTLLDEQQLKNFVKAVIYSYTDTNINKFNTSFILSKLQEYMNKIDDSSIIGSQTSIRLEKRFLPTLNEVKTYELNFGTPLYRGTSINSLSSSQFSVYDKSGIERTVLLEEIPESYTGFSGIQITNPGYGYKSTPTVTITGDGTGAVAVAEIVNGRVNNIKIVQRGINYTKAVVTITGGDGYGATAVPVLDSRYGTLRTSYYNTSAEKIIVNSNAGTIDYDTGKINITNIRILSVNTTDGYIRMDIESQNDIITPSKNVILTIDKNDPSATSIEMMAV